MNGQSTGERIGHLKTAGRSSKRYVPFVSMDSLLMIRVSPSLMNETSLAWSLLMLGATGH